MHQAGEVGHSQNPGAPSFGKFLVPPTTEHRSSPAAAADETLNPDMPKCRRGQVQQLDTYHGLDWDGPGPVPMVYGLEAAKLRPKRGIFRKGVAFQPRCGLRLPDPYQRRP